MDDKSVPTGVKVIAVLYYISAVIGIILGLLFLVGGGMIGFIASQIPLFGIFGMLGSALFVVVGIILIGLSILNFFIGRGLWKAQPWARIVAIIFAALGILMAIIFIVQGNIINIFTLVIELVIGGYLLFNKKAKEAFA